MTETTRDDRGGQSEASMRSIGRALANALIGIAIGVLILYLGIRITVRLVINRGTQFSSKFSWGRFDRVTPGQSRAEVDTMLGTPVPPFYFLRKIPENHSEIFYAVQKNNSTFSYIVSIEYDEHEKVVTKEWDVYND